MRLLTTELIRFWSRRVVWVVIVVCLCLITLGIAIGYSQTSAEGPSEELRAQRTAQEREQCIFSLSNDPQFIEFELQGIPEDQHLAVIENEYCNFEAYIDDNRFFASAILWENFDSGEDIQWSQKRPDTSQPNEQRIGQETVRYASDGLSGIVPGVAIFFLVVAVVIGASYMGAEYRFGTVENLLLWEPRRIKVLATKFLAGFVSAAVLTMFLLGVLAAMLFSLANVHGVLDGLDSRFWIDLASTLGRAGIVGGLFFVLAMSVSVIARNTTAAVGAILGWFVISNIVIEAFAKALRPWELFTNSIAFITEGNVGRYERFAGNPYDELVYSHSYLAAGALTVLWAVVFSALATALFARRDLS